MPNRDFFLVHPDRAARAGQSGESSTKQARSSDGASAFGARTNSSDHLTGFTPSGPIADAAGAV